MTATGLALVYFRLYRHPLVVNLSQSPVGLLTLPLPELRRAERLLRFTHRLGPVLRGAGVDGKRMSEAVAFLDLSSRERANQLAIRLGSEANEIGNPTSFTLSLGAYLSPHLVKSLSWLRICQHSVISASRARPRHITVIPGAPSPGRPRNPPSLAIQSAASFKLGAVGGGVRH